MALKGLVEIVERSGSDSLKVFGGKFEGGYHIQQDPDELAGLIDALQGREIKNYLQIGCAAGGTERLIVETCGIKCLTVIDNGEHPKFNIWIERNKPSLTLKDIEVHDFVGDSHSDEAEEFLNAQHKQFDLIGIDGDHSPAGVRMDWELISKRLRPGVLVWFHDINSEALPPDQRGALEVWEIVSKRHKVIYETKAKFGIGLLEVL